MSTAFYHPTACTLCYANCGIKVQTEGGHIIKVRGDKDHPASRGYLCNKASRLDYYQHGRDRLTSPLRRRSDGTFEAIDWDTAISEVTKQLTDIRDSVGGDKIVYYGGGGQGNHLGPMHFSSTQRALGIKARSNALAQEKTGLAWTSERVLGGYWHGDFETCDVAIMMGKNPWQTNGFQRARVIVQHLSKDPDRTLIVFDPRRTETAEHADIHFAIKPGTDAWCISAILACMAQDDLLNMEWLRANANGYERVLDCLYDIPAEEYANFCGVDYDLVKQAAQILGNTTKVAVYEDLGVEMAPNSTLCSYLNILLFTLRGAFASDGGTHLANPLQSIFNFRSGRGNVDDAGYEQGFRTSTVTGARMVGGLLPCNSIAEEILTDHPSRFRGMIVESGNPAHSIADSQTFRQACEALDLLVVIDVAMTETAQLADYVLPASSQFEKVEATFFNFEYPDSTFHLRDPLFPPAMGTLPEAEIHARIIEAMDIFAPNELDELAAAAQAGLDAYAPAFLAAMQSDPRIASFATYVLYRTLGPTLSDTDIDRSSAAPLWMLCQGYVAQHAADVKRAGHEGEGPLLGNALFKAILAGKSGTLVSRADPSNDPKQWRKPSGKVELGMSEMLDEWERLPDYSLPTRDSAFPLLLAAGERRLYTANTAIRDPEWMKSNNPTALKIHPDDAATYNVQDGTWAQLNTKRGAAKVLVQCDPSMALGTVSLPNGLGLTYPNAQGKLETVGVAPNELTHLDDRDPWVGTPWHKHVGANITPIDR